jgi:integrase
VEHLTATLANKPAFANDPALARQAAELIASSWEETTLKSYRTGERLFLRYCEAQGQAFPDAAPPTADQLIAFATFAFRRLNKSHGTVSKALTAMRALCAANGFTLTAFADMQLKLELRAIRKQDVSRTRPKRVPITVWALARFLHLVAPSRSQRTLFAACVAGQHLLLRASEFVAKSPHHPSLLRSHVTFHQKGDVEWAEIYVAKSKTDTYAEGVTLVAHANGGTLCPVKWLREVSLTAPQQLPDAAFFQREDGSPLTYSDLQSFLKSLCARAGINSAHVGTHSLRIGGCTTLIKLGFSADVVQSAGRWISDAYKFYLRFDTSLASNISKAMASAAEDRLAPVFGGMSLKEASMVNATNFTRLGCKAKSTKKKKN